MYFNWTTRKTTAMRHRVSRVLACPIGSWHGCRKASRSIDSHIVGWAMCSTAFQRRTLQLRLRDLPRPVAPGHAAPEKYRSAYTAFLASRSGKTAADKVEEWRALTSEQKQEYGAMLRPPKPNGAPSFQAYSPNGTEVWPHSGDHEYPVRADQLAEVVRSVKALSSVWEDRIGRDPLGPTEDQISSEPKHLCERYYGRSHSSARISVSAP